MAQHDIVLAIISLISVVSSGYLLHRTNISKDKIKETSTLFESESQFRGVLLKEVDELMNRCKNLELVIVQLRAELGMYEKRSRDLENIVASQFNRVQILELYCEMIPGPVWFKKMDLNNELRMYFVNSKFTEVWGVTCEYYLDKTDMEVWGEEVGRKFHEADILVLKYKRGHRIIEKIPNDPFDPTSPVKEWVVWKFPVMDASKIIGIGGIAIDYVENEKIKNHGD